MRSVRSRGREQMASKHLLTQDKATQDKATQDKATQDKATQDKALGPPSELTQDRALELCRLMVLSRTIEDRLHALYRQGRLRGRLISGRGQEAIPVGFAAATDVRDIVCPVHRDLGAHLARGTTTEEVLLHYLGRESSASGGRDGDLHFGVWSKGVFPMISHLPDSWPIAVGMAFSQRLEGSAGVVVA